MAPYAREHLADLDWSAAEFSRYVRAAERAAVAGWRTARDFQADVEPPDIDSAYLWGPSSHMGDEPLPIDVDVHMAIEAALFESIGALPVTGEEVKRSLHIRRAGLVAIVDPVDGTLPLTHLGFGWSVVVMLYTWLAHAQAWGIVAVTIVDAPGNVMTFEEPGGVWTRTATGADERIFRSDIMPPSPRAANRFSVAAVGAKPNDWVQFERLRSGMLAADSEAAVFNLGGSPCAWGLIQGRLGCAVSLTSQTPWDAAHTLLASQCGAIVSTLEGRRMSISQVAEEWFSDNLRPGEDDRCVPPHVVARDEDALLVVLRALGEP